MRRAIDFLALLHKLDKRVSKLEEHKDNIYDIPWIKNRVTDLEYWVKEYSTKDATLKGIRELELTIADPPNRKYVLGKLTDPAATAANELGKLLKYAHGRGWLSTVDWDEVRSGKP